MATTTHKDRVHEFNAKLEKASEHYDIPKVSVPSWHPVFTPLILKRSGRDNVYLDGAVCCGIL